RGRESRSLRSPRWGCPAQARRSILACTFHFTMKDSYHRAVRSLLVWAVILSACGGGGGLHLRVEIAQQDVASVDEVRVRVVQVPRLIGADLGSSARTTTESGVQIM